jgi:glycosyltransferase involved in cell wall biosynthesis
LKKYGIILPVRNGGEYVKECIGSILSQELNNFNLIVLDNSSTDGTTEYIQSLGDDRIIHYPSKNSLTIEENWARILTIPKNEFITLIGHDDILERHYLSTMDQLVQKHPEATLYQAHFRYIDSKGNKIRSCKPMDEVQTANEFLAFFLCSMIDVMGTGFMMRSSDYDAIGGIPPAYPNLLFADFELMINLTKKSYKATCSSECFAFRLHQSMTTTSSDLKFIAAYKKFVDYLEVLKNTDIGMKNVIRTYALNFIRYYTKGLSHRLLRTPKNKRNDQSVAAFIALSKSFADRLVENNGYDPAAEFSVKLARRIDSNVIFRRIFILFKKIHSKPVYSS